MVNSLTKFLCIQISTLFENCFAIAAIEKVLLTLQSLLLIFHFYVLPTNLSKNPSQKECGITTLKS